MKKKHKIYGLLQLSSAILMIILLCWLTISMPFVYASQQEQAKHGKVTHACSEEETSNPFGNNAEEKTAGGISFSEEYLHLYHATSHSYQEISQYYKLENADTYIAFHGELLVPPPNVI